MSYKWKDWRTFPKGKINELVGEANTILKVKIAHNSFIPTQGEWLDVITIAEFFSYLEDEDKWNQLKKKWNKYQKLKPFL